MSKVLLLLPALSGLVRGGLASQLSFGSSSNSVAALCGQVAGQVLLARAADCSGFLGKASETSRCGWIQVS